MKDDAYWFPVRPASHGWGWGTPRVWQGWVAWAILFAMLTGGVVVLQPYGALAMVAGLCVWLALFFGLMFWKGEPQSLRHRRLP